VVWTFGVRIQQNIYFYFRYRVQTSSCFRMREIVCILPLNKSRVSAVGIVAGYGLDDSGVRSSSPCRVKKSPFSTSSRPALGPTQPPVQWVSGLKRLGREVDHLQLVLRSRKRGSIHPLSHTSSWRSA
jgi:hypothetical protein